MMTLAAAAALLGSSTAGFIGPWVYDQFQVLGLSLISASVMGLSVILLRFFVRNRAE
jgi:hypothetical protein